MKNIAAVILRRELGRDRWKHNRDVAQFLDDKTARSCRLNTAFPTPVGARCCFLVSFSADLSMLASTHGDHSISVFDSNSGVLLKQLVGHLRTPWCIAFHPYLSHILASGCLGGQVRIWDVKTNTSSSFLPSDNHVVTSIAFHPYDDVLAVGSQNILTLWDWQTSTVLRSFSTQKTQEGVRMVKFHPLGDWLLTGITNLPSERHCGPMFLEVPNSREQQNDHRVVQTVSCVTLQPGGRTSNVEEEEPLRTASELDIVSSTHSTEHNDEADVRGGNQAPSARRSFVDDPVLSAEIEADDRANPVRTHHMPVFDGTATERDPGSSSSSLFGGGSSHQPSYQSEMWSVNLGSVQRQTNLRTAGAMFAVTDNDSDDDASATIPVHSFLSQPRRIAHSQEQLPHLDQMDTHSVATATARTSRHVHTAIVISSRDYNERQLALRTAVNRAIASAFAGNGEGAVACNIINTTQRLQLWSLITKEDIDLKNRTKGVVVAACKLHNDSSLDISSDGTILATFLPSPLGFPDDGQLSIISLLPQTLGQCLYKRRYGPNAVSVSISPSKQYALVGLASKRLMWQIMDKQLMGQVVKLPTENDTPVIDDCSKPLFSVVHGCSGNERYHLSVNTARFHPLPGNGFFYGTNRGHVQHCKIRLQQEK